MPGLHRASCGTTSTGAGHSVLSTWKRLKRFCQVIPQRDRLEGSWQTYDLSCPDLWPGAASSLPMRQPKHPPACQKRAHERWHGASNKDVAALHHWQSDNHRLVHIELNGCPIAWWISVTPINPYPRKNIRRILSVGHLRCVELIALSTSTQGCADGGTCYAAQENITVKRCSCIAMFGPLCFFCPIIFFSLFWIRVMPTSGHWPLWCWHLLLCSSRGFSLIAISAALAWGPFQTKYGKGMSPNKWERSQQAFFFSRPAFCSAKIELQVCLYFKAWVEVRIYWGLRLLFMLITKVFSRSLKSIMVSPTPFFSLRWLKSARLVPPALLQRGASEEMKTSYEHMFLKHALYP